MIPSLKNPSRTLFQFDGFTLDLQRNGLYRGDERIRLTPKPLETLSYLVENRGRTVEKQELLDAVWKDTFVTEDTLVHAVGEIRRALEDDKDDPRFVQTIPRLGYRFVGQVRVEPQPAEIRQIPSSPLTIPGDKLHVAKSPPARMRTKRKRVILGFSVLSIVVTGLALSLSLLSFRTHPVNVPKKVFQKVKFTQLTTSGKVTSAVVSPDGKYLVFAQSDGERENLWLRQIATTSNVQITAPAERSYRGLTFSPDGNHFYYVVRDKKQLGTLYQMPVLGGPSKVFSVDVDSAATFSPDGKRFAFYRGYPEKGQTSLVVANTDGTGEQILYSHQAPHFFPTQLNASPAWSPEEDVIACSFGSSDAGGRYMTVVGVEAATGALRSLTAKRWWEVGQVAWLRNDRGLLMTAKEKSSSPSQIWYLSMSTGEARQVTNDLDGYEGLSLPAADPMSFISIQSDVRSSVVIGTGKGAEEITVSSVGGVVGISWTPDGHIIYAARVGGNQDLWIMDKDGREQKQLTAEVGDNNWPTVTPDGQLVVFMSARTGIRHIWRMNIDGSNPRQLTNGGGERWPRLTPDGKWVVYASITNPLGLFKVSIEGGPVVPLTNKAPGYPAISPDGTMIASGYFEEPGANKTAIYSFGGGEPLRVLDFSSSYISWTPDGRALTYIDAGPSTNIFSRDIAGSSAKALTRFKQGSVLAFDWSRDGKLAYSYRVTTSDVVMLTSLSQDGNDISR